MKPTQNSNVPAVDRTLDIFEFLVTKKQATIKEMAEALNIPLVSTSRIVKALVNRKFLIEKKGSATQYSLGIKLLYFSQIASQQLDFTEIAKEKMSELSNRTNQASQLAIMEKGSVIYTELIIPQVPISIIAPLRTPLAINLSAGGKVLCAWMSEKEREMMLNNITLEKNTNKSIIDKEEFLSHLEKVKEVGYAIDDEEFSYGIGCIAAPIFDYLGNVVAAVGLTGPISTYHDEKNFEYIKRSVTETAKDISQELGYIPNQL